MSEQTTDVEPGSALRRQAAKPIDILERYRPAALALTAVIAIVTVLPGAEVRAPEAGSAAPLAGGLAPASSPVLGAPEPVALTSEPVVVPEPPAELPLALGFGAPLPVEVGGGEPAAPPAAPAPPPAAPPSAPPPEVVPTPKAEPVPLAVAAALWVSRTGGTPLAATGVPAGSLPVGKRATLLDKASFVRLSGTTTTLALTEVAEGTRGSATAAEVAACQVLEDDWEEGQAKAFDAAPGYDPATCVTGKRDDDGTWTFDLSAFPTRTDARGLALVPTAAAPADFQVAFATAP